MELSEYDNIIRHLVASITHLGNISDDLRAVSADIREFSRQQLTIMTELQGFNREQLAISQRMLRLLENVTGQSSNGTTDIV